MVCVSGKSSCFFKLAPKEDVSYYLCLFSGAAIAVMSSRQVSADQVLIDEMFDIDIVQQNLRVQARGIIKEANISVVGGSVQADR